jgi:hypothetical protein
MFSTQEIQPRSPASLEGWRDPTCVAGRLAPPPPPPLLLLVSLPLLLLVSLALLLLVSLPLLLLVSLALLLLVSLALLLLVSSALLLLLLSFPLLLLVSLPAGSSFTSAGRSDPGSFARNACGNLASVPWVSDAPASVCCVWKD